MESIYNELRETIKSKQKRKIQISGNSDLTSSYEHDRYILDLLEFKLSKTKFNL